MKYLVLITILSVSLLLPSFATQIGVNFSEDSIGVLGDYKKVVKSWEFEVDAQSQLEDRSLISNVSAQYNLVELFGIKPFGSYVRDDMGNTIDVGILANFNLLDFDIAGGASFRGSDPTAYKGEDGFDADGNAIKYFEEDPSNTYKLPDINNVNAIFNTGFEKWRTETDLTLFVPITKRDVAPTVLIGRTQVGFNVFSRVTLSFVVDTRTYIHKDGVEVSFTPTGGISTLF